MYSSPSGQVSTLPEGRQLKKKLKDLKIVKFRHFFTAALCGHAQFFPGGSMAADGDSLISYSLDARPFASYFESTEDSQLNAAGFDSGVGLQLRHELVDFSLDYNLKGMLSNVNNSAEGDMAQLINGSLRSALINDLLGANAAITTSSRMLVENNSFSYTIQPAVSKSLYDFAELNMRYSYLVDKPPSAELASQRREYSLGLNGDLVGGRLTWQGSYLDSSSYSIFSEDVARVELRSQYRLGPELHLELSGTMADKSLDLEPEKKQFNEASYGAGLLWSPNERYSVNLRLDRAENDQFYQKEYISSGTLNWHPEHDLQFSVGYGDRLLEGQRGLMFSTKIHLDDS